MSFESRWKAHLHELTRGKHVNIHLQRSFNKHGKDAFVFAIVKPLGKYDKFVYFQHENELMNELKAKGHKLYNIAMAQGGWSFHDAETKKKIAARISAAVRANTAAMTPDERRIKFARWVPGISYPDSAKHKISQSLTGIVRSDETRAKMKAAQALLTDDKRDIMRAVGLQNKGRLPPNTRQVMLDDGTTHESLKKAAEHLGMSSSGLIKRMKKHELGRYI